MTLSLDEALIIFRSWMSKEAGWTPATVQTYYSCLKRIIDVLGIKSIDEFNVENIKQQWQTDMWRRIDTNDRFSDSTRNGYLVALKAFLRWGEGAEIGILPGIAQSIKLPRVAKIQYSGLNQSEQRRLREYLISHLENDSQRRNAALILFLWSTGCRISEALQLDVHGDGIILTDELTRSGSFEVAMDEKGRVNYLAYIAGKGKKNRTISVSHEAIAYINLYLDQRPQKSPIVFMGHHHGGIHPSGQRLKRISAYEAVRSTVVRAGIAPRKQVQTHIFRHTAITNWIKMGFSDKWIMNQTGLTEAGLEIYHLRQVSFTYELAKRGNPINVRMKPEHKRLEKFIVQKYGRTPSGLAVD